MRKIAPKKVMEDHESQNNEIFERTNSLGCSVDEEIVSIGCRCPPACRCKTFSIGLKVQETELKGPSLNASKEIGSLPCCCNVELPCETLTSTT